MRGSISLSLALTFLLAWATPLHAHTRWALDGLIKPRSTSDGIKSGPCGVARTNKPTQLQAGTQVELKFESVIYHQGIFRVSFSPANDANFVVLADNIKDYPDKQFQTVKVTLPDIACEACTLQLIQTMPDHGDNSLYYSCADIKLIKAPPADTTPPNAVADLTLKQQDKKLALEWTNPNNDYFKTLVVQSLQPIQATPAVGLSYQPGDIIGNAKVVANAVINQYLSAELPVGQKNYFAVFAYDAALNYSVIQTRTGELQPAPNSAPSATLSAEQNRNITTQIKTTAGKVVIQARVQDNNAADIHSYDWAASDYRLVDTDDAPSTFTIDPFNLVPGQYKIVVTVNDSGSPALSTQVELLLQIEEPEAPVGGSADLQLMLLAFAIFLIKYRLQSRRKSLID